MRPANTETKEGSATRQRVRHVAHLIERHDGGDVQLDPAVRQAVDQRFSGFAFGVRDRDLHVDVIAPRGDLERLALHLGKIVGEDSK
jgi:hypothetical protein